MKSQQHRKNDDEKLSWFSLSLFGAGCTLGTGFFLGTSLAIHGPEYLYLYCWCWRRQVLTLYLVRWHR